jgi:uncharacterized protein (DUF2141 family)
VKRLLMLAAMLAPFSVAQAADIEVTVSGLRGEATVYFALFDRDTFLGKPIAVARSEPANPVARFKHLPSGKYALSAYQDINGNGLLDRGIFGIPKEPSGFSNDATGMMGPPKFDSAAIQLDADNLAIVIKLH